MTGDFFLTQWFFLGMRWLCENVVNNNIFLTILISTILLRLITLFSDIKQRKSSTKIAELQPQVEKLQQRYKNDPQRLQQEQAKLMKESGVSMFSGCLPMILTMVFLFCFIAAFRFWGYEQNVKVLIEMSDNIAYTMKEEYPEYKDYTTDECIEKLSEIVTNGEMTDDELNAFYKKVEPSQTFLQSKFLWINNIWQPDNGFKPVVIPAETFFGANYSSTKKLIYFKEHSEQKQKLENLGIFYDEADNFKDMSKDEQNALREAAYTRYDELMAPLKLIYKGHNNGWFILPVLATLFQLLYAWYSQKQTAKTAASSAQGQGTMKVMLYIMPIMTFVFCLSYTSAFAIYWTLSSLTMLIVNIILTICMKPNKKGAHDAKKEA